MRRRGPECHRGRAQLDPRLWHGLRIRRRRQHDAQRHPDGQTYTYDEENRLTGAAGYTYTYDGDGNRVRKSNGNLAANGTLYWYMTPGVVAESDLRNVKSEYVFFDGERVARRDGATGTGGVFYYFSDHLKTASVITDSAGVIKAESDYYPWGGELQFVDNDSNDYKFTGKKRDWKPASIISVRGITRMGWEVGQRDWSMKPVAVPYANFGDPQSLNLYSFVEEIRRARRMWMGMRSQWIQMISAPGVLQRL